ncbi:ATP F0F1 synthase subunit B, partial [Mesorhizobium sp. M7A.F.Ca.CA.002.10.1.1]
ISALLALPPTRASTIAEDTASAIVEALVGGKASKAEIAAAVKSVAR